MRIIDYLSVMKTERLHRARNRALDRVSLGLFCVLLAAGACAPQADVCIYGGTSAAVTAARAAAGEGRRVVIICPDVVLGGMTTGGLGATDIGNKQAIIGMARGFYRDLGAHYGVEEQWTFEPSVAQRILEGNLTAALVTDAGTPCISDPGSEVVRECAEAGIGVIPVPGCCAGVAAVSVSGYDAKEFAFYGFLPREKKDIRARLEEIARGPKVAVLHESPFRITELTEVIAQTLPGVKMTVCCDLTKLHEKTLRGIPEDVLRELKANEKTEKGEYCVVLDLHGVSLPEPETETAEWPLEAKLIEEMKQGKTLREAQDALAEAGEKQNAVKQAALTLKKLFE